MCVRSTLRNRDSVCVQVHFRLLQPPAENTAASVPKAGGRFRRRLSLLCGQSRCERVIGRDRDRQQHQQRRRVQGYVLASSLATCCIRNTFSATFTQSPSLSCCFGLPSKSRAMARVELIFYGIGKIQVFFNALSGNCSCHLLLLCVL